MRASAGQLRHGTEAGFGVKTDDPGPRRYHSPRRAAQAAQTRRAILAATHELLAETGYAGTTVAAIAARAEVSVDTVYASVGRKPEVLRQLVETAISGTDETVPALQRDYVRHIESAATAQEKITIYSGAIAAIQTRLAPVFLALRDAAATDPDCMALWREIATRRARNMRGFAASLRATGELRDDLSDDEVADILWSMNAAEYWVLLVHERPRKGLSHRVGSGSGFISRQQTAAPAQRQPRPGCADPARQHIQLPGSRTGRPPRRLSTAGES